VASSAVLAAPAIIGSISTVVTRDASSRCASRVAFYPVPVPISRTCWPCRTFRQSSIVATIAGSDAELTPLIVHPDPGGQEGRPGDPEKRIPPGRRENTCGVELSDEMLSRRHLCQGHTYWADLLPGVLMDLAFPIVLMPAGLVHVFVLLLLAHPGHVLLSHVGSYGLDVSRAWGDDLVGGHTRLPRLG
jgi:hypothetical protein